MKKILILLFAILYSVGFVCLADNGVKFDKKITGVVVNSDGEPLPGATLTLIGTHTTALANVDGEFSMQVKGTDPRISVSYVGMKPMVVTFNPADKGAIRIIMEESPSLMSEVVVTGYQNLKREKATGSYQTITSKEMEQRYTGSIVDNLEGLVPGLVKNTSGTTGSGDDALVIRGIGTLQASTRPLIVVDGLPIEGSIESVNPYDIENITVLKDAAAAAIYGARASNGVIVITSKKPMLDRVSVDFNADISVSEKPDYSHYGWASAAELIELEKYNFDYVMSETDPMDKNQLMDYYNNSRFSHISPVSRLLIHNSLGKLSDADLNAQLDRMSRNNYVDEYKKVWLKNQVQQQYNVAVRQQGRKLSSSIVLNYKRDNNGVYGEHSDCYSFKYNGLWHPIKFMDVNLGVNLLNERSKTHSSYVSQYASPTSFPVYTSMYNADGTLAAMENMVPLDNPRLNEYSSVLKSEEFNLLNERDLGFARARRTNIRAFFTANFKILPGWSASAHFQYEDIDYKCNAYAEAETYAMRHRYNLYVGEDYSNYPNITVKNNLPDGGQLDQTFSEGKYYTFRIQSRYENTFIDKHYVEVLAGMEYRDNHTTESGNVFIGYDDRTQTNQNAMVNWYDIGMMTGMGSILNPGYTYDYGMYGAPSSYDFYTNDILHRFYSIYFTGNYVYDNRYAVSGSWRVDKTDLFGADPKYRGRPLWSIGLSWNIHNESFMKDVSLIDALKPRFSYGTTGNIDQSVSSYLTASMANNYLTGNLMAALNFPPNDQLRWEKTNTYNFGVDFSLLGYRLSGSLDYYHKKGSDLLTVTDLDPTTGWTLYTLNNGCALNKGVELQLNGQIIRQTERNTFGLAVNFNMAYNKNKVTKITHEYTNGYELLSPTALHEGYPVHSLFSYRYAGVVMTESGNPALSWIDHKGIIHDTSVLTPDFTKEDIVYSGALDPKMVMSLTPAIKYGGFTLSGMFNYYGGHVMRIGSEDYCSAGSETGYYYDMAGLKAIPSSYLDYWRATDKTGLVPNGAAGGKKLIGTPDYMDATVDHADYLKLRNIVLTYEFAGQWMRKCGLNEMRVRAQINNVATWARNSRGIDPEAVDHIRGFLMNRTPRSYTLSLYLNF